MEYIESDRVGDCIFCTLPEEKEDAKNLILYRGPLCFVIMNRFPYNSGHLMVSSYRHLACVTLLSTEEHNEMNLLTARCVEILRKDKSPDGFNIGINLGKSAGAGFDEHIHTHIVPRWNGDTNFMPVIAETKIHPQHILDTFSRLQPHFQTLKL